MPNDEKNTVASVGLQNGGGIKVKDLGVLNLKIAFVAFRCAKLAEVPKSRGRLCLKLNISVRSSSIRSSTFSDRNYIAVLQPSTLRLYKLCHAG